MRASGPLTGTVAWVTGGGRGIGRAIAHALASDGAAVVVSSRSVDQVETVARELERHGAQALAVRCDVTDVAAVQAAYDAAVARFEHVDTLINNAGLAESALLVRTDDALWARTIAVNLSGTFYCARAVLPEMVKRRRGRIVNVASTAARVGYRYTSAYCAAKHGVLGLTRSLALEVVSQGITVNAVCPGWVDTGMTAQSIQRIVEKTGRSHEDARRSLEMMNPLGRLIRPEEVAAVVRFLVGPDASSITGQAYGVDGGEVMG